ncbi:MAG: hypothetical protein IJU12_12335 [Clostridia bacterium]|nr:hypothetical protein [Clostridia bacterium]
MQKIESEAREAASQALIDAQKRAEGIRTQGEAQLQAQRDAMDKRIQAEKAEMEGRMLRMAELENKKAQLAVKRQVMDEAFALAVQQLNQLPDDQKRAFFKEQLLSAAQGDETVCVGDQGSAWFTDAFLREVNDALAKAGKPGQLTRGESVTGCGFELRRGGEAQKCTFEALVEGSRMALEGDVARELFPE